MDWLSAFSTRTCTCMNDQLRFGPQSLGVRAIGWIRSPRLFARPFQYKPLFYVGDWMPTLLTAAGGGPGSDPATGNGWLAGSAPGMPAMDGLSAAPVASTAIPNLTLSSLRRRGVTAAPCSAQACKTGFRSMH